jgi:hypothetical protein
MEGDTSQQTNESGLLKRISDMAFSYYFYPGRRPEQRPGLQLNYSPQVQDTEGRFSAVSQLAGNVFWEWSNLPPDICAKLEALERIVIGLLPKYEMGTGVDSPLRIEPAINMIICAYDVVSMAEAPGQFSVVYFYLTMPSNTTQVDLWDSLARSQRLVVSNLASWAKKQAWMDLANRIAQISGQPAMAMRSHKVFISYKKNSRSEQLAEAVANRLSQQGMVAWFDKWEIKAGDSIPGKIGEGFRDSNACLIFLSHEYSGSNWCTKEMNTALVKAIGEQLTVIPSLVETCNVPELLKDLKRVDFVAPTASEFEQKLVEITDAIYKVDLNAYR